MGDRLITKISTSVNNLANSILEFSRKIDRRSSAIETRKSIELKRQDFFNSRITPPKSIPRLIKKKKEKPEWENY